VYVLATTCLGLLWRDLWPPVSNRVISRGYSLSFLSKLF